VHLDLIGPWGPPRSAIATCTFSPLTVKGGDTIPVTNSDPVEHTVT
jgi:hypothetical protein